MVFNHSTLKETVNLPRRPGLSPQRLIIRFCKLFGLKPFPILAPDFYEAKTTRSRRILEDVEEDTFRLPSTSCPDGSMGDFELFDFGGVDEEVNEEGKLFLVLG